MKLTIIIPVYNELNTIEKIINKVLVQNYIDKEIIIIDDGSNDGTTEIIKKNIEKKISKAIYLKKNSGKGAAIKSAIDHITGDMVIIQDADLEYNPDDYKFLIDPILKKESQVVYGSRVLGKKRYSNNNFVSLFRVFANHLLTILSNLINKQQLTDAHTCYKLFETKVIKQIKLHENGFGFCPEITTKIGNLNIKIKEIPISYKGRSVNEGKKINFIDGLIAIKAIFKYSFFKKN